MNIKASIKYQLSDHLKGCLCMCGTLLAVLLFFSIMAGVFSWDTVNLSVNGFSVIVGIYLFVVGIVAPRSYLRLDAQMGVSRKTTFVSMLLCVLIIALLMALVGELLSAAAGLLIRSEDFFFADIYQLAYNDGEALSLGGHAISAVFNICAFLYCYAAGMFFTLLFWRLSKFWTVFAALAIVVLVNLLLNAGALLAGVPWFTAAMQAFFAAVVRGPGALMLFFLVSAAVLAGIEWLLLRRAYIKASV